MLDQREQIPELAERTGRDAIVTGEYCFGGFNQNGLPQDFFASGADRGLIRTNAHEDWKQCRA